MKCSNCNQDLPKGAGSCPSCGFPASGLEPRVPVGGIQTDSHIPGGSIKVEAAEESPAAPKCSNCGEDLPKGAGQCPRCGLPVTRPEEQKVIEFLAVPTGRLIFLSVITMGFYQLYWLYKNWQAIRKADQSKISPFWRTMFIPFFCHGFFKRILDEARQLGYQAVYNPWTLAIVYIILLVGGHGRARTPEMARIRDFLDIITGLLVFIPALPVQRAINYYHEQAAGTPLRTRFTAGEMTMVVAGVILLVLNLVGLFFPDASTPPGR